MRSMGGCNSLFNKMASKPELGSYKGTPGAGASASQSKGGTNKLMAQSGKTSQGKAVNFRGTSGKSNGGPSSTTNPRMKLSPKR